MPWPALCVPNNGNFQINIRQICHYPLTYFSCYHSGSLLRGFPRFCWETILLICKNESGKQELKTFLCLEIGTTQYKYRKKFFMATFFLISSPTEKIKSWLSIVAVISNLCELALGDYLQIIIIIKIILVSQYLMSRQHRIQ